MTAYAFKKKKLIALDYHLIVVKNIKKIIINFLLGHILYRVIPR